MKSLLGAECPDKQMRSVLGSKCLDNKKNRSNKTSNNEDCIEPRASRLKEMISNTSSYNEESFVPECPDEKIYNQINLIIRVY